MLTAAVAGMITGTRAPTKRLPGVSAGDVFRAEPADSYQELRGKRRGPNAHLYEKAFAWLRSLPGGEASDSEPSEEDRERALAVRAERRAYAGAPPVIPHPVQDREASACLACHDGGARIGTLQAPAMSHEPLTMCTQCHAVAADSVPQARLAAVGEGNIFVGAIEPGAGSRAWEGAPPTIPHATFMRENCSSCHGPRGQFGLRTPHPNQANCQQCHAAEAPFDQGAPPQWEPTESLTPSQGEAEHVDSVSP